MELTGGGDSRRRSHLKAELTEGGTNSWWSHLKAKLQEVGPTGAKPQRVSTSSGSTGPVDQRRRAQKVLQVGPFEPSGHVLKKTWRPWKRLRDR